MDNVAIYGLGTSGRGIGLYLGGDPKGPISPSRTFADGKVFENILVSGFHTGVAFGDNAWVDRFEGALIMGNGTGTAAPHGADNSGEAMAVTDSTIANNGLGIEDDVGFEFFMASAAMDYNRTATAGDNINLHALSMHFEQSRGNFIFSPYGTVRLLLGNVTFLLGPRTGSDASMIGLWPQSANVKISRASIWSNHPVPDFLHIDAHSGLPPQVALLGIGGKGNGKIKHITDAPMRPLSDGGAGDGGLRLGLTTVRSLPACNEGVKGEMHAVSDAGPSDYDRVVRGGGTVSVPVYCNGSAWTVQ